MGKKTKQWLDAVEKVLMTHRRELNQLRERVAEHDMALDEQMHRDKADLPPPAGQQPMPEGYFTKINKLDVDCDHGPCTGYYIEELGLTVYIYDNKPDLISFHID